LLVIAGHTIQLSWSYPIYAFHLPLFFLITGMLINPEKMQHVGRFLAHKARRLLIPWCVCLMISFVVTLMVPQWREGITLRGVVKDLYTLNTNFAQNSSLWYLPCLFFALIYFCLLRKIQRLGVALLFIAAMTLLLRQLLLYMHLPTARLPFKMDSALIGVFFVGIGFCGRDIIIKLVRVIPVYLLLLVAMLGCVLFVLNGVSNVSAYTFGKCSFAYYPIAFLGAFLVIAVSKLMPQKSIIARLLSWFGRNSLIIFCFQSLFVRGYLLIVEVTTGRQMVLYGSNPVVHQLGAFVAVAFVLSPLWAEGYNRIWRRWLTLA